MLGRRVRHLGGWRWRGPHTVGPNNAHRNRWKFPGLRGSRESLNGQSDSSCLKTEFTSHQRRAVDANGVQVDRLVQDIHGERIETVELVAPGKDQQIVGHTS